MLSFGIALIYARGGARNQPVVGADRRIELIFYPTQALVISDGKPYKSPAVNTVASTFWFYVASTIFMALCVTQDVLTLPQLRKVSTVLVLGHVMVFLLAMFRHSDEAPIRDLCRKIKSGNVEDRIDKTEFEKLYAAGGKESLEAAVFEAIDGYFKQEFEAPDDEPPNGMTTCLLRPPATGLLAAGNSDTHSQLRIWDLKAATLRDRFTLPAYCKGIRALVASSETTLVGGAGNGWVVLFDLRSGRFERRLAHTDCVNTLAVASDNRYLISGGDDKSLRVTDLRKMSFSPATSFHILRSEVPGCNASAAMYEQKRTSSPRDVLRVSCVLPSSRWWKYRSM